MEGRPIRPQNLRSLGSTLSGPVGVVVPTRNSARTLAACLRSLRDQSLVPFVVVVDNNSTDSTQEIARELADLVVVRGPERSAQRNWGAALLRNFSVVGFVDSDMVVEPGVVAEAQDEVIQGAGAVIVPEHTVGGGWVAKVRAFERSQYVGNSQVEAARFFSQEMWQTVGGFDETLTAAEDWDLALRMADAGARTGRTASCVRHDEHEVGFLAHCSKKARYAEGLQRFMDIYGDRGRQLLLDRPYLRRPWSLLRHPVLGVGLLILKLGEVAGVSVILASRMIGSSAQSAVGSDSEGVR